MFGRFAFPPNSLGYCGPVDTAETLATMSREPSGPDVARHVIPAFQGAWPYLELIGHTTGNDPLSTRVVEAYWIGSPLLEVVGLGALGDSLEARFRKRAGWNWSEVVGHLNRGGRPNHAFHVFCVYPWAGLLRAGIIDQPLAVLDRCRIRWGRVEGSLGEDWVVRSRPLVWEREQLRLGPARPEVVRGPADGHEIRVGETVALHWDYVCQRLTPAQSVQLRRYHDLHLAIVNRPGSRLAAAVER